MDIEYSRHSESKERFIACNFIGNLIQSQSNQETQIYVEFNPQFGMKNRILFQNKVITYCELQKDGVGFANSEEFGYKSEDRNWNYPFRNIKGLCMGSGWIALHLENQVRVYDLNGYLLTICQINRLTILIKGYQNILCLINQEDTNSNRLRMKLVAVREQPTVPMSILRQFMVPLSRDAQLSDFGFSREGIIYSQDSKRVIRVWIANKNQWKTIYNEAKVAEEDKFNYKFIQLEKYQPQVFKLHFNQTDPEVNPRSQITTLKLTMAQSSKTSDLQHIAWQKAILDHERFRNEQWYRHKLSRKPNNPYYDLSSDIMSMSQIQTSIWKDEMLIVHFVQEMIQVQKNEELIFTTIRTYVKNEKTINRIYEIFDQAGLKVMNLKIKAWFDQKTREMEHEFKKNMRNHELRNQIQVQLQKYEPNIGEPDRRQKSERQLSDFDRFSQSNINKSEYGFSQKQQSVISKQFDNKSEKSLPGYPNKFSIGGVNKMESEANIRERVIFRR